MVAVAFSTCPTPPPLVSNLWYRPPSPDIKGSFLTIRLVRGQSEFASFSFFAACPFSRSRSHLEDFFWHSPSRNPPEASDVVGPLGTCRSSLEFLGGEKIEITVKMRWRDAWFFLFLSFFFFFLLRSTP